MKLLPPQEVKNLKESQTVKELLRAKEMAEVTDKTRKALAKAEADFNTTLAKNRTAWALEEEAHDKRVREMAQEIRVLEKRRQQALIPIDAVKSEADTFLAEAKKVYAQVTEIREEEENLTEELENKLDLVGQRGQDLDRREAEISNKEYGLRLQTEQMLNQLRAFNAERVELDSKKMKAEQDIDERKTALVLWDRQLVAKEERLNNKEKGLDTLAKQLDDRRATLDRAFARLSPMPEGK